MKKILSLALTSILMIACSFNALAGWEQTGTTWKYKDDTTSTYLTGWQWIDGNNDGIAECYYLDSLGVMASSSSIDGYTVNEQGQWTVAGVVQTKVVSGGSSQSKAESPSESSVQDNPYVDKSNPYAYDGDYKIPEPTTINIEHDGFVGGSSEGLPAMH